MLDAPVGTLYLLVDTPPISVMYADERVGTLGVGVLIIRDERDSVVLARAGDGVFLPLTGRWRRADGFVLAGPDEQGRVLVAWREEH